MFSCDKLCNFLGRRWKKTSPCFLLADSWPAGSCSQKCFGGIGMKLRWNEMSIQTTLNLRNLKKKFFSWRRKKRQKKVQIKKTYTTHKGLCIMLQTQLVFLPGSQNKSLLILNKALSFCYLLNRLLTKLVRFGWLNICLFRFRVFILSSRL